MSWLCNVDPFNPSNVATAEELLRYGCRGVRLVSRHGVEAYVAEVQGAGLLVLAVITEQSGGYICPADILQIGNEPDLPNHGDSFSEQKYLDYWNLYYGTWFAPGKPFAGVPVISAGLASGNVSYWQAIAGRGGLPGCSGLSLHPYAKTAAQAKTMIQAYQRIVPAMPIFVTEWHRPAAEVITFQTMLNQTTTMSAWFAWGYEQFALTPTIARMLGATA